MRGEEHGLAELLQVADHLPCIAPRRRIEARRRLVEEEQLGVSGEPDGHVEPTLLTAGQLANPCVSLLLQAHYLDDLVQRPRVRVVPAEPVDHFGDREEPLHPRLLENDPYPGLQRPFALARVVPQHAHLAAGPLAMAFEDLDRRRLAGSVGPQQ